MTANELPWLATWLPLMLRSQRGHALLLHGPAAAGQFELALAMAQAWLCEAAQADATACGRCEACTLCRAHTHPDLRVLVPEAMAATLGWEPPAEPDSDSGKSKPSKDIRVEALRAAIEFAQQTSSRGRAQVVLIHPAERMNAVSANALLKVLEEPPGRARFILCTAAPDRLLPTLRSRCQLVPMPSVPRDLALTWLSEQGVPSPEVLLDAAGGLPLVALEWHHRGLRPETWVRLPRALAAGDVQAVSGWPVPVLIDAMSRCCEDAMRLAVGGSPRYFPADAWRGLQPRLPPLLVWQAELKRVARHDEHPWHAALMCDALVSSASRALHCTA
ncbi:MAG: DNA polymerase III subunit delta' [Caldimonas sp.]|nr:MAG: DNA polymerase III subunit delta' [Caldimonas sp.]